MKFVYSIMKKRVRGARQGSSAYLLVLRRGWKLQMT